MGMIMCGVAYIVLVNCQVLFRLTDTLALQAGLAIALDLRMFILDCLLKLLFKDRLALEKWKGEQ